jgi:hypothetical protein
MTPNQEKQKDRARQEAEHHANNSNVTGSLPERRFKSRTEMQGEEMLKDAEKEGLHMEIE